MSDTSVREMYTFWNYILNVERRTAFSSGFRHVWFLQLICDLFQPGGES